MQYGVTGKTILSMLTHCVCETLPDRSLCVGGW